MSETHAPNGRTLAYKGSLVPPAALMTGTVLDRYQLLMPIGEGGMASVWLARQVGKHGFERLVAIKTILPKFSIDRRFQESFLDEARITCRVRHTNAVTTLDVGEERGILYIVFEWIDGEPLSKLAQMVGESGERLPMGVMLRIIADACAGLHAAHELKDASGQTIGIVHRDVSPQNILVTMEGIAKVIDFGIAKASIRLQQDTTDNILKGKLHYMAPEQANGEGVDRRTDVWALGAVLYRLIVGKTPYDADDPVAVFKKVSAARRPPPLPPSVHEAIRTVIHRAISPCREDRYDTALDMRVALEGAMFAAGIPTGTSDVEAYLRTQMAASSSARHQRVELVLASVSKTIPSTVAPHFDDVSPISQPISSTLDSRSPQDVITVRPEVQKARIVTSRSRVAPSPAGPDTRSRSLAMRWLRSQHTAWVALSALGVGGIMLVMWVAHTNSRPPVVIVSPPISPSATAVGASPSSSAQDSSTNSLVLENLPLVTLSASDRPSPIASASATAPATVSAPAFARPEARPGSAVSAAKPAVPPPFAASAAPPAKPLPINATPKRDDDGI